ncbi:Putative arginine/ornithine antiporter [Candidatus Erwinia haradaeae]|uniref:Arginine/ornithine antiporter, partial n=1 Tax=Candidatus Erwinia haradaeae TaxID=1922217 RepID=A0A451DC63_9GAMM|nr:basic amino acid/polyamine antiporter [Candidatus Erwinia haradaeae]VFP83926.1 Putative arginine/ornithine antiporter [Candidatus Erwinia haradaeae]
MDKKLDISALTALVLSSMLGAGIFNLPQNMAEVASPAALLIGWSITGCGVILLALVFLLLSRLKPNLEGGIFIYAQEGFGKFIGFCSAWGYWLCTVIANASYLVIVCSAIGFFIDSPKHIIFGDGNTWQAMLSASLLLWLIHALVLQGIRTAASINFIATLGKLIPLGLFILLAAYAFQYPCFCLDFTGLSLGKSVWQQVKDSMLVTLWVFIGIEGAVVMSSRARHTQDIGRATIVAVLITLAIYLLISLLSLGVIPRAELATMHNPSMAGIMNYLIGPWGSIIIIACLIVSVCGAYLSWTIMAAEIPLMAVKNSACQIHRLQLEHNNNAQKFSLYLTDLSVQLCLIVIWITNCNYNTLLTIASEMILIPYLLVGAYLFQVTRELNKPIISFVSIGASAYGIWLLYASGPFNVLLSLLFYVPGMIIFLVTHQKQNKKWINI